MHSSTATVNEYLQAAPAERQEALRRIRNLCQASLPSYQEGMEGGKPVYRLDGEAKVAFASQAHHIAFYVYDAAVRAAYEAELSDPHEGMAQFNKPQDVDFELIEKLLHDTGKANKP